MKTRTRQVPATTNNITTGIINFLNSKGHLAIRVNTIGLYDPIAQIFRKPDANSKGCPDILACMNYDGVGYFAGIEVKNGLTGDRMRADQEVFHKRILASGGLIFVAHSYQEFLDWYKLSGF